MSCFALVKINERRWRQSQQQTAKFMLS